MSSPPSTEAGGRQRKGLDGVDHCLQFYIFFSRGIIRILIIATIIIVLVSSILSFSSQGSLATRPGSFSFHIHKFLNIKQVSDHHGIDADKQKQNFDDHRMRTENIQTKMSKIYLCLKPHFFGSHFNLVRSGGAG